MQLIEIKTLVDITNTKVSRPNQGTQLEIDQHRNFTTLKQCAELRSIISYDFSPDKEVVDVKDQGFGSKYKGKHAVWTFRFSPDRSGAYANDDDDIGCLLEDVHGVPVVEKLTETINIEKAIFELIDASSKNTVIKAIKGTI
jgi:hypothetical protein